MYFGKRNVISKCTTQRQTNMAGPTIANSITQWLSATPPFALVRVINVIFNWLN